MQSKDLIERFSGFREPGAAATALLFLYELSAPETRGQPPREARWQRILDRPASEWDEALDRACRACAQAWAKQLDVLLTNPPFGTSASAHTFATHAERGTLVIPDHVLYRQIPRVATYPVEEPEPASIPAAVNDERATAQIAEPGEQLRLPWAA